MAYPSCTVRRGGGVGSPPGQYPRLHEQAKNPVDGVTAGSLCRGRRAGVVATAMVVLEPFPSGAVLVTLTRTHGIDVGDLPAIVLYLVAGGIALAGA